MFRNSTCLCLMLLLLTIPVFASDSKSDQSITKSTEFSINQVLDDLYALVDTEGVKLFKEKNKEMDKELKELFDVSILRSKLEQFYTMLFYISKYALIEKDDLFLDRQYIPAEFPTRTCQSYPFSERGWRHPRCRRI